MSQKNQANKAEAVVPQETVLNLEQSATEAEIKDPTTDKGAINSDGASTDLQADTSEHDQAIEVRILTRCQLGAANEVTSIPSAALAGLKSLGYVDDHPDAVAFAKSLKAPKA